MLNSVDLCQGGGGSNNCKSYVTKIFYANSASANLYLGHLNDNSQNIIHTAVILSRYIYIYIYMYTYTVHNVVSMKRV